MQDDLGGSRDVPVAAEVLALDLRPNIERLMAVHHAIFRREPPFLVVQWSLLPFFGSGFPFEVTS